jgi:tRNA threonylcarbamoyladenosine biosynthesis protein TsaB
VILAFDTATSVATSALVRDGEILASRTSAAVRLLQDVDELLSTAGARRADISALAVGTGPGSFTGVRIGLAAARALAFALGVPVAGVSTLTALAAGTEGAVPVIDARRREVFTLLDGSPTVAAPRDLDLEPGSVCVGDGAIRYRSVLEAAGAHVPPDGSDSHVPHAFHHAALAREYGAAESVEPIYLRLPDAERAQS